MRCNKIKWAAAVVLAAALFAGCEKAPQTHHSEPGQAQETVFFTFTVDDAEQVDEFAGYEPVAGNQLVRVDVPEQGTFHRELPMYAYDFQLHFGDGEYANPLMGLEDDSLMPAEFPLQKGDEMQYSLLFEVPEEYDEFSLIYLEQFSDGSSGDLFSVDFTI